jgi:RNA polymerase sigma-70 factor (ECF subfamily)
LSSFAAVVDVEAVLQETLLRVWQVAPKVQHDGRPDSLLRFAIRVARNLAVSDLRRRREPLAAHGDLAAPVDLSAGAEPDPLLRRLIAECHEALPDKPRQAIALRVQRGGVEPDRALAAELGMRLNTFVQNLSRARKLLAECLSRRGVELGVGP